MKSQTAQELEPRTIYIKNINFRANGEDLANFFEKYGTVKKANILTEYYRGQSVSRGIGFVEFAANESLAKVMADVQVAINEKKPIIFKNRALIIQQARVRQQRKRDTAFIGGISQGITVDDIKNALKAYNPVDAKIVGIINANRRGFAFVKFATSELRDKAVKENKTITINGNESVVRYARRDFDDNHKRVIRYRRRRNYRRAPKHNTPAAQ